MDTGLGAFLARFALGAGFAAFTALFAAFFTGFLADDFFAFEADFVAAFLLAMVTERLIHIIFSDCRQSLAAAEL
ncbi:MAG: hypothetical protein O3C21_07890 [Verrucomicrobia bacterium]|nr:hypothetical protein [Verrucomicrobiota bacterium]